MARFDRLAAKYLCEIEAKLTEFLISDELKKSFCAEMSRYQLETGGKRIRALIPLMVFDAFNKDPAEAIELGCAVELIHNATLVHDDLQDGDEVRRGKPTIWKKYSQAQAINCGDALFFYALAFFSRLSFGPTRGRELQALAIRSTLAVIEGQAQEFQMKQEEYPPIARYLEIIRGKTSGLFSLPLAGALMALGADQKVIASSGRCAHDLGMVFQIHDDLIDIYGEKERGQKAADIAEGKTSFLVAVVNEQGSAHDKEKLMRILSLPRAETTQEKISEALELFEKYGARHRALAYIAQIRDGVINSNDLAGYPEIKSVLVELSDLFLRPLANYSIPKVIK